MKENDEFLPIGSVVLLKEATRKIVIIGFAGMEERSKKMWDYIGCAYPIGMVSSEKNLLFNKDQIEKVVSVGYSDDEDKKFRSVLASSLKATK